MSQGSVKRWVLLMAVGGPACLVLAVLFPPFALVGLLAVLVGGLGLTLTYSKSVNRWSWIVVASVTAAVFVAGSVVAWDLWGTAFDLSDRGAAVPGALTVTLGGASLASVLGMVAFLTVTIAAAVRAKRRTGEGDGTSLANAA